ncbi:MAG: hypothetical protein JSS68_02450 [Actinobacteria bacterium]|nr:hypothetical protein [Actinomycetota bacterium]MBS1883881.1 hypothetical protein [Actinomycetota bacterium]
MKRIGIRIPGREGRPDPRLCRMVLWLALPALVMGATGVPAALGAAGKTYHLTAEVLKDKKPNGANPGARNFSDSALLAGSRTVGKLALTGCNGLAISELTCSGRITLGGLGSGLQVVIRWPCEIGAADKVTCASVGEGFITSGQTEKGTIRIATEEGNLFKAGRRFLVTIKSGG